MIIKAVLIESSDTDYNDKTVIFSWSAGVDGVLERESKNDVSIRNDCSYELVITLDKTINPNITAGAAYTDVSEFIYLRLNGEYCDFPVRLYSSDLSKLYIGVSPGGFSSCLAVVEFFIKSTDSNIDISPTIFGFAIEGMSLSIKKLVAYVKKHAPGFLNNKKVLVRDKEYVKGHQKIAPDLKSFIRKLGLITAVYQQQAAFFQSSAYSKTNQRDTVDSFHKLKSFSSDTLRFIVEHPDELMAYDSKTGIEFRGKNYLPRHTLITTSIANYDIYENQVILSFLKLLLVDIRRIKEKETYKNSYSDLFSQYILNNGLSSDISQLTSDDKLRLEEIYSNVHRLYALYRTIFSVHEVSMKKCPQPTAIFLSVNAYRLIYSNIRLYYQYDTAHLDFGDFYLNAIYKSKLYEYFCLIGIKNALEMQGFTFINSTASEDVLENSYYTKPDFNSVFHFESDTFRATLIYQPVIYSDKDGMTGLYRSSNITISSSMKSHYSFKPIQGNPFYTPDYSLCVENKLSGKKNIMLFDAKNKESSTVAQSDFYEIVFKYMLSITAVSNNLNFVGVDIICGKYQGITCRTPTNNIKNPVTNCFNSDEFVQIKTFSIDSDESPKIVLRDSLFL